MNGIHQKFLKEQSIWIPQATHALVSKINTQMLFKGVQGTLLTGILIGGLIVWKKGYMNKVTSLFITFIVPKNQLANRKINDAARTVKESAQRLQDKELQKDILDTIEQVEENSKNWISKTTDSQVISTIQDSALLELSSISNEIHELQRNSAVKDFNPDNSPEAMEWCIKIRETLRYPWDKVAFRRLVELGSARGYLNRSYTAINITGGTILHTLAKRCSEEMLAYLPILKEAGADFAIQDNDGNTALLWSIANASNTFAMTLLNTGGQGPYLNVQGINRNTALHLAIGKGYRQISYDQQILEHTNIEIAELLIALKADVNLQNANGDTALHLACVRRDPEAIRLLVQAGASIYIKNKEGNLPHQLLHLGGHSKALKYLEKSVTVFLLGKKLYEQNLEYALTELKLY